MDLLLLLVIIVASILCFLLFGHLGIRNGVDRRLAPKAAGAWPIIGHLHLLAASQLPHRLLGSMADKFGPIFTIKLGVHQVLVVSNSEMAKECLTANDKAFASRPKSLASELMGYKYAVLGFSPYGPYWRLIRKIIVIELLSHHRLQMLAHIRVSEVRSSIKDIYTTATKKGSSETVLVDMKEWFENLIVNIVVRMMFGDHFPPGEQNGDQFRKAIKRLMELVGTFVPSDAIPWLRWLDLGGYEKLMKKTAKEMDVVIHGWIEDQKRKMNSTSTLQADDNKVFLAAILSRVKEEVNEQLYGFSTDEIVKATCLV